MKYLITMKDGTQYTDEQHRGFVREMAYNMSETDYPKVHEASDGSFAICCSEVASVRKLTSSEDAA